MATSSRQLRFCFPPEQSFNVSSRDKVATQVCLKLLHRELICTVLSSDVSLQLFLQLGKTASFTVNYIVEVLLLQGQCISSLMNDDLMSGFI